MALSCISVLYFCILVFVTGQKFDFPDDDMECKRHNNEGVCRNLDGHYTCACLFHEKPSLAISEWHAEENVRVFTQHCEPIRLPYHEDTCLVLPGNPWDLNEQEFLCPNNGFFQTWGAFAPKKDSYSVRLWFRCCEVTCPKWSCNWTPFNPPQERFELPLRGVYVQGMRGKYVHDKLDSSWALKLCVCDVTATEKDEL